MKHVQEFSVLLPAMPRPPHTPAVLGEPQGPPPGHSWLDWDGYHKLARHLDFGLGSNSEIPSQAFELSDLQWNDPVPLEGQRGREHCTPGRWGWRRPWGLGLHATPGKPGPCRKAILASGQKPDLLKVRSTAWSLEVLSTPTVSPSLWEQSLYCLLSYSNVCQTSW